MRLEEKRLRMRVFTKAFLFLKGGKYSAKEIAEAMNECGIGLRMGTNSNEVARDLHNVIRNNKSTKGFMRGLAFEKGKDGRGGLYYLEKKGDV